MCIPLNRDEDATRVIAQLLQATRAIVRAGALRSRPETAWPPRGPFATGRHTSSTCS